MYKTYMKRVKALAKWKYDIEEDIIQSYEEVVASCYAGNFTARRTTDYIAKELFK